eukprot:COSAG01_NODE_30366_length_617_cov_1.000000_1_plen_90_part_00
MTSMATAAERRNLRTVSVYLPHSMVIPLVLVLVLVHVGARTQAYLFQCPVCSERDAPECILQRPYCCCGLILSAERSATAHLDGNAPPL